MMLLLDLLYVDIVEILGYRELVGVESLLYFWIMIMCELLFFFEYGGF